MTRRREMIYPSYLPISCGIKFSFTWLGGLSGIWMPPMIAFGGSQRDNDTAADDISALNPNLTDTYLMRISCFGTRYRLILTLYNLDNIRPARRIRFPKYGFRSPRRHQMFPANRHNAP